jgi:LPXTG-motif cell wall-anchored protein
MTRASYRSLVTGACALAGVVLVAVPGAASAGETSPTSCTIELDGDTLYDESSSVIGKLTFDQVGFVDVEVVVDGDVTSRDRTNVVELDNVMVVTWSIVFESGYSPTTSFGQRWYAVDGVTPLCSYTVQWGGTPPTDPTDPGSGGSAPTPGGSPMLPETGVGVMPLLATAGALLVVGAVLATRRKRPA